MGGGTDGCCGGGGGERKKLTQEGSLTFENLFSFRLCFSFVFEKLVELFHVKPRKLSLCIIGAC